MNARHSIYLRNILEDLGYPQPPTIILCDNKCAVGIATDAARAKRSKAIDMRWHWIRDQVRQNVFNSHIMLLYPKLSLLQPNLTQN